MLFSSRVKDDPGVAVEMIMIRIRFSSLARVPQPVKRREIMFPVAQARDYVVPTYHIEVKANRKAYRRIHQSGSARYCYRTVPIA